MKHLIPFFLLTLLLANCKNDTTKTEVEPQKPQTSIAVLVDSVQTGIDSIVKQLAIKNKCRVVLKAGKMGKVASYFGYDGRSNVEINRFSQPYEIGSSTKMFTATSILQLMEKDSLSLDDKLVEVLPHDDWYEDLLIVDGKDYIDEVRIVNLLNHSSGFADYFAEGSDEKEIELHGDSSLTFTPEDIVGFTKLNKKNSFKPNEKFQYSNLNYILLGLIIEKYAGMSYQDYIQAHILDPLGLEHTYFGSQNPPTDVSKGFYKAKPVEMPYTLASSAGEIISTLDDMEIFINAWYLGNLFEKTETIDLLHNEHYHDMTAGVSYGLGAVNLIGQVWGHPGQTFGSSSFAGYLTNGYSIEMAIDDAAVSVWEPAIEVTVSLSGLE